MAKKRDLYGISLPLVLDEPMNHLDLDMRDALALALQAYAGAVLIVAHDRDLLEKLSTSCGLSRRRAVEAQEILISTRPVGCRIPLLAHALKNSAGHRREIKKEQRRARRIAGVVVSPEEIPIWAELRKLSKIFSAWVNSGRSKTHSGLAPDELTELLTRAGTKRQALERVEKIG